jgi:hypothetical protein
VNLRQARAATFDSAVIVRPPFVEGMRPRL